MRREPDLRLLVISAASGAIAVALVPCMVQPYAAGVESDELLFARIT